MNSIKVKLKKLVDSHEKKSGEKITAIYVTRERKIGFGYRSVTKIEVTKE